MKAWPDSFVALRHRNYRLIWIGLLASMTGSTMQNAALLWHVSLLVSPERKGLALGIVGLVKVVPIIVFSMVSGVVADTWNRRRLMLFTCRPARPSWRRHSRSSPGAAAPRSGPSMPLAALAAAVGTFDLPARQALVPMLVPREHLPNAISLNTIMFQTASVIGPSLGGVLIAVSSVAWAYAVNALSFAFVIVALLMMRDVPEREPSQGGSRDDVSWHAALQGLQFVFRSPLIRSTMLLDFFATFFSSATALLPIFAQDILEGRPAGLRLAVRGAGGRRDGDQRRHGPVHRADQAARPGDIVGGRRSSAWPRWSVWRVAGGSG